MSELDRTKAFERSHIALFSPTGSGYVNYVATESYEFLARGDCASAAIQYSVLPSPLSLDPDRGGHPANEAGSSRESPNAWRPCPRTSDRRCHLFGESLGCKVSQEMFTGASGSVATGSGDRRAPLGWAPRLHPWRTTVWAESPNTASGLKSGPGAIYATRAEPDWRLLPEDERARGPVLPPPEWRRSRCRSSMPAACGGSRTGSAKIDIPSSGAPIGTKWQPVTTFVTTLVEQINALAPTPGQFEYGGPRLSFVDSRCHRRCVAATRHARATPANFQVMEHRELAPEITRLMAEAEAKPEAERAEAMAKTKAKGGGDRGQANLATVTTHRRPRNAGEW